MTTFELTYNPFTKEKTFQVNGEKDDLEECWGSESKELSEWVAFFYEKLYKKYNDSEMKVKFKGILRDYEFLEDAKNAYEKENPRVKIELIDNGCSNTNDKIDKLKKLFEKMLRETPFAELKKDDVKEMFEKALSNEFEMAVIATMSSGKSTLINAMLGRELLPARNEATTATIARIHDTDGADHFRGFGLDKAGKELGEYDPLDFHSVDELNKNPETLRIEIYGDIVGIESRNLQLVLTDTPGPNNSQTVEHRNHTYRLIGSDYKPMILYVLNGTQLQTNDDALLLQSVANAMKSGGRQSQERFIFVLNKADEFDPQKGENLANQIEKTKKYLEEHEIKHARVFPTASRMAKIIRQAQNKQPLTETEEDEILPNHTAFVKREWRHFSDYAPLSSSMQNKQNEILKLAKENNDTYQEALIYTGVPAVELAISEYLAKYALPAKITEAVFAFKDKIDKLNLEAEETVKMKDNAEKVAECIKRDNAIEELLKKGDKAKKFKDKIDSLSVGDELTNLFEKAQTSLMFGLTPKIRKMKGDRLPKEEAEKNVKSIKGFLPELESKFSVSIQEALDVILVKEAAMAVKEYKRYVAELVGAVSYEKPVAAVFGDLSSISVDATLNAYAKTERVKVGEHWVENTNKKWYKPWTWFSESGHFVSDYENQEFVDFDKYLENEVLPNIQTAVDSMRKMAFNWAKDEEKRFKEFFKDELQKLNDAIMKKLEDRRAVLKEKDAFEKLIKENEQKLRWIKDFRLELESLLAI